MRVHTSLSVRQTRKDFAWVMQEVQRHERSFVVTVHGKPAAAVVPLSLLRQNDATDTKRQRRITRLLRLLAAELPGAASSAPAGRQRR